SHISHAALAMTGISEPSLLSRPRYQVLLDNAADAVMVLDEQNRILEWSEQAQALFGWTAEEMRGKTLTDTLLQSPDALLPHEVLLAAAGKGMSVEHGMCIAAQARHKEGRAIAVSLWLQPFPG